MLGQARGYADVFYRDRFAWENKAPGKNLEQALKQLLTYSLALSKPPLLVECDRLTTRIHTQFNGHPSEVHTVLLHELDQPKKQALLRRVWTDPESFRPKKTSRDIAEAAMEVTELRNAAGLNWSAIDMSIFGTLFERGLDQSKRSQLDAHYTDPATILRIIEPVLMRPLLQKWELVAQAIRGLGQRRCGSSRVVGLIWPR